MTHPFRERVVVSMRRVWGEFGSPRGLGADARYTPAGGGAPVDIRVSPGTRDATLGDPFAARTLQTQRYVDVLASDVPARPGKGATFAMLDADGNVTETFAVTEIAVSEDKLSLVWRCPVGEPS